MTPWEHSKWAAVLNLLEWKPWRAPLWGTTSGEGRSSVRYHIRRRTALCEVSRQEEDGPLWGVTSGGRPSVRCHIRKTALCEVPRQKDNPLWGATSGGRQPSVRCHVRRRTALCEMSRQEDGPLWGVTSGGWPSVRCHVRKTALCEKEGGLHWNWKQKSSRIDVFPSSVPLPSHFATHT